MCRSPKRAISGLLLGREIYRRTEYLVLRNGSQAALVGLRAETREPLFTPVTQVRMLSGPDTTVWIDDPDVDVGNASSLAACGRANIGVPAPSPTWSAAGTST